jgi:hypothetical protein
MPPSAEDHPATAAAATAASTGLDEDLPRLVSVTNDGRIVDA